MRHTEPHTHAHVHHRTRMAHETAALAHAHASDVHAGARAKLDPPNENASALSYVASVIAKGDGTLFDDPTLVSATLQQASEERSTLGAMYSTVYSAKLRETGRLPAALAWLRPQDFGGVSALALLEKYSLQNDADDEDYFSD